jgi:L-noviosyl transferase
MLVCDVPVADYARASVITGSGAALERDLAESARGWAELATRVMRPMDELVEDFRPDLIISDPAEFAGRFAAAGHQVPWVEHGWGLPFPEGFRRAGEAELLSRGLSALPTPDVFIHPSPPAMWPAGSPEGIAMRYVPYNGTVQLSPASRQSSPRPRIFLTFGSLLFKHDSGEKAELFRKILEELSDCGYDMIIGMDPAHRGDLGDLPSSVLHAGWIPLAQALKECDLVIHHGGSGTSMSAAATGVPQVIMPYATDQFVTAQAMVACSAAICLLPDQATPAAVREAVTTILADLSYTGAAAVLSGEIAALASPSSVAGDLRSVPAARRRGELINPGSTSSVRGRVRSLS